MVRPGRIAFAVRGGNLAWNEAERAGAPLVITALPPVGVRRATVKRPTVPVTASIVAHATVLILFGVLVGRSAPPQAPAETAVALMFQPAPEQPAPAPAAPLVPAPDIVPDRTDTSQPTAAADTPAPAATETPPVPAPDIVPDRTETTAPTATVSTREAPARRPAEPPRRAAPVRSIPRPASAVPATPATAEATAVATAAPMLTASVIPPRPLAGMQNNRAPVYPEIARRRGEQGRVMLRVDVSASGAPVAVQVVGTSGYPVLDAAAESAVRGWRFVPATEAGRPVAAAAEVPINFQLEN